VKRHQDHETFHLSKDQLALWKAIEETHRVASVSTIETEVRRTAREVYRSTTQHAYESIVEYRERFEEALKTYYAKGNPLMADADIASDFLNGLDDARHSEFKINFLNNITLGAVEQPKTYNEVYQKGKAIANLSKRKTDGHTFDASFTTRADMNRDHQHDKGKD
jgi:hypothetical protein